MSNDKMDAKRPLMTHAFPDRESAQRAYDGMTARGYKNDEIHVLMSDETRKRVFGTDSVKTDMGNKAMEGAGVGGAVGGAVGATVVGLAAAAAALTVPGIGLVIAGPIAGALAGGAAGATAGGLLGLMVGAGIPEDRAKLHETEIQNGAIVLGIMPRHEDDTTYFESEWRGQLVRK